MVYRHIRADSDRLALPTDLAVRKGRSEFAMNARKTLFTLSLSLCLSVPVFGCDKKEDAQADKAKGEEKDGDGDKADDKADGEDKAGDKADGEDKGGDAAADGDVPQELKDFLGKFDGTDTAVEAAIKEFGVEGLDDSDMSLFTLKDPKVLESEGDCYTFQAAAGMTTRKYKVCMKDKKIESVEDLGME